jgi:undecaprenyl diphosphate synthase
MDGNGRWAKSRRSPRAAGHKKGVGATKKIVTHAGEIGLPYLTLYAFSTENWTRPDDEINDLMTLLRFYLKSETAELLKNNVRLRVIGRRDRLSKDIIDMIENIEEQSKDNKGLNLNIALDYGSREEILNAVNMAIKKGEAVTEEVFSQYLYTSDIPDPDLLIRTSGEYRISNFLLWQCAYSEFYFTDILWPDFTPDEFDNAIQSYNQRKRRFGGVESKEAKA